MVTSCKNVFNPIRLIILKKVKQEFFILDNKLMYLVPGGAIALYHYTACIINIC